MVERQGKLSGFNPDEISPRSIGDQAGRAECFEGVAKHIAEVRRLAVGIEILQDDHRWTRQFIKSADEIGHCWDLPRRAIRRMCGR